MINLFSGKIPVDLSESFAWIKNMKDQVPNGYIANLWNIY